MHTLSLTSHAERVGDCLPRQADFAGSSHHRLVERSLSGTDSDLRDCDPRESGIIYCSQRIRSLSTVGVLDLIEQSLNSSHNHSPVCEALIHC